MSAPVADKPKTITITIDGQAIQSAPGALVIDLCKQMGIDIPHYCYHPSLSIAASCRMCLVEVEKLPKLAPSCQLRAQDGMVVQTNTQKIIDHRKAQMEFMLLNHPLDCPVCDKGGECRLQRYSMDVGSAFSRYSDNKRRTPKQNIGPLIDLEVNRCIHCTRCVRFSGELAGEHEIYMMDRADRSYISTFMGRPVKGPLSGNVIELCPVGCLTDKVFRFSARVWDLKQTNVSCTYCPSGCRLNLWSRRSEVHRVTPVGDLEDNKDFICNKGRYLSNFSNQGQRTKTEDGALAKAAKGLGKVLKEHGPGSIAIIADGRLLNEDYTLLSRLGRQTLGTANLDTRLDMQDKQASSARIKLAANSTATKEQPGGYMILGSDLYAAAPLAALHVKEKCRQTGEKLILAHHRACPWFRQYADAQLVYSPDCMFGFISVLCKALEGYLDDAAAERFGLNPQSMSSLAEMIKEMPGGTLMLGEASIDGPGAGMIANEALRLLEILKALGAWELRLVVNEANSQGAFSAGFGPADLTACAQTLEQTWGSTINTAAGMSIVETYEAIKDGKIKALIFAGDGCLTDTFSVRALNSLDCLVTLSSFTPPADWPGTNIAVATRYESAGSSQDLWGNVVASDKSFATPPHTPTMREALCELASELGANWKYSSVREITLDWIQLGSCMSAAAAPDAGSAPAKSPEPGTGELWWITDRALLGDDPLADRSPACDSTRTQLAGQLHPETARALGMPNGGQLKISNAGGDEIITVEVKPWVAPGVLYAPINLTTLRPGGQYPAIVKVERES
jgi:NADH-quinone oxidoreductase subunit G